MPEGAIPKALLSLTKTSEPDKLSLRSMPSTPLPAFPQYDVEEGARTPEPIKVTRMKKKGTGKKKKPRDVGDDAVP
jgi:AP-3 complex subunit delta-1